jgi:hypothetical protein
MRVFVLALLVLIAGETRIAAEEAAEMEGYLLLDDFTGDRSAIDTEWKGFTDQVMGGVSDMSVVRAGDSDGPYLRMSGTVSLENNGGFIQVRLMLKRSIRGFDAGSFEGIRVEVRGEGDGYYIFLRTTGMILPWKYFAAPVPVKSEWQVVDIPWSAFKPGDYGRAGRLRIGRLRSLALVAYGKEFDAAIDLREIGLYR